MKKSLIIFMLLPFSIGIAAQTHLIGNNAPQETTLQARSFTPENYQFQVGDTVVINQSCTQFLTGEKPSQWVFGVRHVVGKVGSNRFPNGIWLQNICTWIEPRYLKLEHAFVPSTPQTPIHDTIVVTKTDTINTHTVDTVVVVVDSIVYQADTLANVVDTLASIADTAMVLVEDSTIVAIEETHTDTTCIDTAKFNPQIDRFTIGVRAGVASFLQKTSLDAQRQLGCNALLDLQYAHYWVRKNDNKFGLLVGLSAGYVQGGLKSGISQQNYTVQDPDGWKAEYTTKVDKIRETDRQIQLEIPLMFSMITTHGFFLNVGPRFLLPVYTPYSQTIENPDIRAYFEKTDVEVRNEVITGLMNGDELKSSGKTKNAFKLNITIGLELGYEWHFKNNHSLGLGAYVNYGVYSMFKNDTETATPFIEVTPAIPSVVSSESTVNSWTKKMGYVDGGIKIAYHFNWKKE